MVKLETCLIIVFVCVLNTVLVCSKCNYNISHCELSCTIDLTQKNLRNLKDVLDPSDKFVALTIDDGPTPTLSKIMSILEDHQAKATFFLVGKKINEKTVGLMEELLINGHEMGSHTWFHNNMTLLSYEEQFQDLERTNMALENVIGRQVKWFRPPYGCYDYNLISNVHRLNMYSMLWTIDPEDYSGNEPEVLFQIVMDNIQNGGVVLFHDHENKTNTVDALPKIIEALKSRGYSTVTLSEWEKKVCSAIIKTRAQTEVAEQAAMCKNGITRGRESPGLIFCLFYVILLICLSIILPTI